MKVNKYNKCSGGGGGGSYDEGYVQGKIDGTNEQKSKLESINITENGTYTKEDGYNHIEVNVPDLNGSYDEGYKQGQADVAANARVLNVTENGVYTSKYSEPLYEKTGDNFYNYIHLTDVSYDTGVVIDKNSVIEFWIKPYDFTLFTVRTVFGLTKNWRIFTDYESYKVYIGDLTNNTFNGSLKLNEWNHIVFDFAKNEGLFNGEKITNICNKDRLPDGKTLVINGAKYDRKTFNGCFGMIKINDIVFIPTENGFLNTTTNEYLQKLSEGEYEYFAPVMPSGPLYKTINVNVIPKINLQKTGLKLGFSTFTEVPEWADFEGITDMSSMFNNCKNIQTIPLIDTSNVTNMLSIFLGCSNLQTIPLLNTSNVSNMEEMFYECINLQTIPSLDTSKVTNMYNMFANCRNLTSIPALNTQSLNMNSNYGIFGYSVLSKLTDFGGFLNLKQSLTSDYAFKILPNLTRQSCINVLNGLYDFTGNGETPGSNQGQLKVHQNFLDAVGNEISIGTSKGWQITV